MRSGASAKRYAQAVFEIARENDEVDGWLDDLAVLVRDIGNREAAGLLDSPRVAIERKAGLVRDAVGGSVGPMAVNLALLMTSRGISYLLPGVADEYQRLVDSHRGIERAEVISAVKLEQRQLDDVARLLRGVSGKDVDLADQVEPDILGGLIVRVGDKVMDGSARTRLLKMRKSLA